MQAKNMRLINIAIELINTAQDDEVRNELVYQDIKDRANGKEPEEPKKSYLNADDLNKLFETVSVDEHNEPIPEKDIAKYKPLEGSLANYLCNKGSSGNNKGLHLIYNGIWYPTDTCLYPTCNIGNFYTIGKDCLNFNLGDKILLTKEGWRHLIHPDVWIDTREEALDKLCNDEEFFPLDERLTLIGDELSKIHSTLTEKISKEITHTLSNNVVDLFKLANSIKDHNVGKTLNEYSVVGSQINGLKNVIFELTGSYNFITESLEDKYILLRRKGDSGIIIKHAPVLDDILVIIDKLYRIQREY